MAGACDSGSRQKHLIRNRLIIRNIMTIQQRIVNDSLTEIYVNGGGNFITQSRPTNFHQFFTRKILTPTEDISDFREVTAAERTALEQADALWEEPSAELIAQFNQAMTKYIGTESSTETFGHYAPETGYFMYGSIALSSEEVRRMLDFRKTGVTSLLNAYAAMWQLSAVAPILHATNGSIGTAYCFYMCRNMKVVAFNGYYRGEFRVPANAQSMFDGCYALEEILGTFDMSACNSTSRMFQACQRLREVRLKSLITTVSLSDSPLLSLESISYMIENATNTAAITITLHPTAYARVTDELFALAAEKNITIAST